MSLPTLYPALELYVWMMAQGSHFIMLADDVAIPNGHCRWCEAAEYVLTAQQAIECAQHGPNRKHVVKQVDV